MTKYVVLLQNTTFFNDSRYNNYRGVIMIRIHLSRLLGERRMTQSALSKKTGIRPGTINELYHEFAERVNSNTWIKSVRFSIAILMNS